MGSEPERTYAETPLRFIGRIHTPYAEGPGTPIQAVYAPDVEATVVVEGTFAAALDDVEGFERIWLVYWFDASGTDRRVADGRFHG